MMPLDSGHIDWQATGGWIAAVGLGLTWLWRGFSVVGRLKSFEATVDARLAAIEARQDRHSKALSDIHAWQQRHLEAALERLGRDAP